MVLEEVHASGSNPELLLVERGRCERLRGLMFLAFNYADFGRSDTHANMLVKRRHENTIAARSGSGSRGRDTTRQARLDRRITLPRCQLVRSCFWGKTHRRIVASNETCTGCIGRPKSSYVRTSIGKCGGNAGRKRTRKRRHGRRPVRGCVRRGQDQVLLRRGPDRAPARDGRPGAVPALHLTGLPLPLRRRDGA